MTLHEFFTKHPAVALAFPAVWIRRIYCTQRGKAVQK